MGSFRFCVIRDPAGAVLALVGPRCWSPIHDRSRSSRGRAPRFRRAHGRAVDPEEPCTRRASASARTGAGPRGLDYLVVYGDREHSANIAYLTGFEPRFEEAMLLLAPQKKPVLVVGNEGWGYVGISPLDLERVLFQSFSLLSQPRSESPSMHGICSARRASTAGAGSASSGGNTSLTTKPRDPRPRSRSRAISPTPSGR